MGKIINSTYVSLDGVIERPQLWSYEYFNDEAGQFALDQLRASDALVMGRHTYDVFAASWPERTGDPFTERMNSMRKYVVSSSLQKADWTNTTIISGDVAEQLSSLKRQHDLLQYGFGPLSRLLLEHGLMDELRLWLHPILAGRATTEDLLFRETAQTKCTLVNARTLQTGVVILSYRPTTAR